MSEINFTYTSSNSSRPTNELNIRLFKDSKTIKVKVDSKKLVEYYYSRDEERKLVQTTNKTFNIDNTNFENIVKAIKSTSIADLNSKLIVGRVYNFTSIKFGNQVKDTTYKVENLGMDDRNNRLKNYSKAYLMLFELAEINHENYID